jgi:hypothetical protein
MRHPTAASCACSRRAASNPPSRAAAARVSVRANRAASRHCGAQYRRAARRRPAGSA